jgi:putative endonuclease
MLAAEVEPLDTATLGRRGEDAAARYLEARGMTLIERNWRCRAGEIDIVALDGRVVVFCEVKTRRGERCGSADEAVDARKQRRLARVARRYLARNGLEEVTCRFDVVSVAARGHRARLRHHVDAFSVD